MRRKHSDIRSMVERVILAVMLTLTLWLFTANRLSSSVDVTRQSVSSGQETEQGIEQGTTQI